MHPVHLYTPPGLGAGGRGSRWNQVGAEAQAPQPSAAPPPCGGAAAPVPRLRAARCPWWRGGAALCLGLEAGGGGAGGGESHKMQ